MMINKKDIKRRSQGSVVWYSCNPEVLKNKNPVPSLEELEVKRFYNEYMNMVRGTKEKI